MKHSFSLPVAIAAILLFGAIASVVIVAWQYGGGSHVIVNVVRFFDFDSRQVVQATTAGAPANLNWVYGMLLVGVGASALLENVGAVFSLKTAAHLVFGLIVTAVFFGHLNDAISCAVQQHHGWVSYLATGFTLGFTVEELALKFGRIADKLGVAR